MIIDAIIGTGIRGILREPPQATAIELINKSSAYKVAVDIPSGLDPPDTGEVRDIAVKAHVTVTMHRPKTGLIKEGVNQYVGELMVADIGVPEEVEHVVGPGDLYYLNYARRLIPRRVIMGVFSLLVGPGSSQVPFTWRRRLRLGLASICQ